MSTKKGKQVEQPRNYEIRPGMNEKFSKEKIYKEVKNILDSKMLQMEEKYNHDIALTLSREISDDVRSKLKDESINLKRYKIFVHTIIGEKRGQGIKLGCKCMWDATSDAVVACNWENESTYAFCVVYGVYFY
ncbi:MAG: dynein light chain Tctex-type family protein [archaeon]|nr:dynein light chain Tctex-type family protein [archaeon]